MRLEPALWTTEIDSIQLEQILLNLVVNARDAMPDGGEIVIATSNEVVDESGAADGTGTCLLRARRRRRHGSGNDPGVLGRVFDPFFTTKPKGEGTGLGLAMVFALVKQVGGYVYAQSDEGRGSRFTLYLPVPDVEMDQTEKPTV